MADQRKNYYGSLCTEMYELLHPKAPQDELEFYLSYADAQQKILEPLCGSGRFRVPFLERGYDIRGMDLSEEMLTKLREKAPDAQVTQADILSYETQEKFNYIFVPSGSISLFTEIDELKKILCKIYDLLAPGGCFVFAVDTVLNRCPEDLTYQMGPTVRTEHHYDLRMKGKITTMKRPRLNMPIQFTNSMKAIPC